MDIFDIVTKLHELMCSEAGCRDLRISMTAKLAIYEIEKLRKERDEARREVCAWQGATSGNSFRDTATVRGWDCFKVIKNGKY